MLSRFIRPASVFLVASATFSCLSRAPQIPQQITVPNIGTVTVEVRVGVQNAHCTLQLFKTDVKELVGTLEYFFNNRDTVHMSWLRVERPYRRYGIGKILFGLLLQLIKDKKYKKITWSAYPTDPEPGNSRETQLPKLIEFYESIGGIVLKRYPNFAEMEYDLEQQKRR